MLGFLTTGYWRLIAERPRPLLLAFLLLFAAAALGALWAAQDPPRPSASCRTSSGKPRSRASVHDMTAVSRLSSRRRSSRTTSRDLVAFPAHHAGIFTALALVYNGLLLGVIGGLMVKAGNGVGFVDLVTAHGVLELSCILVAGAADSAWLGDRRARPSHPAAVAATRARRAVLIAVGRHRGS